MASDQLTRRDVGKKGPGYPISLASAQTFSEAQEVSNDS